MGKNKRFIAKGEGSHYHLMHRSHTDKAHANEENPSNYVLVLKGNQGGNNHSQIESIDVTEKLLNRGAQKDHVNALGFKNDGYDYSQHLKVMGGGKFIGKDGKVQELEYQNVVDLPEDALPSGQELERDLQAITISQECMDDDMKAALFGDDAEFGEFEELQDDFVLEAMQEPVEPDFDFDAHIAALIARSERLAKGGDVSARGWERPSTAADEQNGEDGDEYEESLSGDEAGGTVATSERRGRGLVSAEQQALIDAEFEKTLAEYEEEHLGDLEADFYGDEEDGEEEEEGSEEETAMGRDGIDVNGSNAAFNAAIEEFLKEEQDLKLVNGIAPEKKGLRRLEEEETERTPDFHEEFTRQLEAQEEFKGVVETARGEHKEIESCQEYLRDVVEREEWDCESILSTYSTLDNHPALIKTPSRSVRSSSGKSEAASTATSNQTWVSEGGHAYKGKIRPQKVYDKPKTYTMPSTTGGSASSQTARILLTGRLQLPEGFQDSAKNNRVSRQHSSIELLSKLSIDESNKKSMASEVSVAAEVAPESDEEEDSSGEEDEEEDEALALEDAPGRVKETPEEKKRRKQKVKEDKRLRRTMKKQLKTAFKTEYVQQVANKAKAQDINSVRVFKYTV